MADALVPGCYSCGQELSGDLAPRENIICTDQWRVAHAFNSTLPGWLVLLPNRHAVSFTQLPSAATDELGDLIRRCSAALEAVTGCERTYLMQFSEAEGFSHLHLHLVPRMADQPVDARGPSVFSYLTDDEQQWIPEADRDALALALRTAMG